MTNFAWRLVVFFVGLPAIVVGAFAWPDYSFPVYSILVVLAASLAAWESWTFLPTRERTYPGRSFVLTAMGGILPLVGYLSILGLLPAGSVVATLLFSSAALFAAQALRRDESRFSEISSVTASHLFVLVYPGLFAWAAVQIASLSSDGTLIAVFVISVYLNDSLAYFAGRLFGRRGSGRNLFPISPHKSIIGYLVGLATSVLVIVVAPWVWPQTFPVGLLTRILFGLVIGITAIFGDLAESAFKRSATMKDSGQLIPGRGGLLDSIDSPIFVAPFFYFLYGACVS